MKQTVVLKSTIILMVFVILYGVAINGFAATQTVTTPLNTETANITPSLTSTITPEVMHTPNPTNAAIPTSDGNSNYGPFNPNPDVYGSTGFVRVDVGDIPHLQAGAKYCIDEIELIYQLNGNIIRIAGKYVQKYLNEGRFIFTSHNNKIVTVNNRGCVTALKNGETQVDVMYCSAEDFDINNPGNYKTTIDVKVVKNKVALSKKRSGLKAAESKKIKIKNYPNGMVNKIRGSFNKKGIARIEKVLYPDKKQKAALLIKGLKKGKTVLRVKAMGKKLRCKVIVK